MAASGFLRDDVPTVYPSENFKTLPHFQWHLPLFLRDVFEDKCNVV